MYIMDKITQIKYCAVKKNENGILLKFDKCATEQDHLNIFRGCACVFVH